MNKPQTFPSGDLAARRAALVAQCAVQRVELVSAAAELRASFTPLKTFGSLGPLALLGAGLGRHSKIPLIIGGVLAGLAVTGSLRLLPLLEGASSLWRVVRSASVLLRSLRKKAEHEGSGADGI